MVDFGPSGRGVSVSDVDVSRPQVQPVIHPVCEVCVYQRLYSNELRRPSQGNARVSGSFLWQGGDPEAGV